MFNTLRVKSDLLVTTGSHLYGVATKDSDLDQRGFFFDRESFFSLPCSGKNWEQVEDTESDTVIYNLHKFLELLIKGNTQAIEVLYSPLIISCTDLGQSIINIRNSFLSHKFYRSMKGFAFAEYHKAKAVKQVIKTAQSDKINDALHTITSTFNFKRHERNEIIKLIEDLLGEKITDEESTIHLIGDARLELIQQYGYDIKAAYHTVRLLSQAKELFNSGQLTFPRPEKDLLVNIRSGHFTLAEWEEMYQDLQNDLDKVFETTTIPKNPDMNTINKLWMDLFK